jgi:hypothetical protein
VKLFDETEASKPDPLKRAAVLVPVKAKPCARRLRDLRSGRKNARGAGRTKESNLPKQYPTRSPILAEPTPVAVFGTYPGRHSHCAIFARILTAVHR